MPEQTMQPESLENMTFAQKRTLVVTIMMFPALTVMVFLRHKIGYRRLKPWQLFLMALLLVFLPTLGSVTRSLSPFGPAQPASSYSTPVIIFVLAMLALGLVQRHMRWTDIRNGVVWHTYSPGVSYLSVLPLRDDWVRRFVDPLACAVVGFIVWFTISTTLGWWLVFSALALYIVEQYAYEQQLEHDLDILDGLFASQIQSETMEHFSGGQQPEKLRPLDQTGGIPTGIASDIVQQIAKRQAAQKASATAKPTPDNLAASAR
jgi:hypothetical protein